MTNIDETLKKHRSYVRVVVTYFAAAFVFFGGGLMIAYFILTGKDNHALAKDIFTAILPIGTAVITFWFAGRAHEKATAGLNKQQQTEDQQGTPQS